ncbi:unnamed protein product, partial [Arabidopsis halleri]
TISLKKFITKRELRNLSDTRIEKSLPSLFSDAGKALPCRRRDTIHPAFLRSRSHVSALSLVKLFYLFKPSRIFSNHMHLPDELTISIKGDSRWPAESISHPLFASSSPTPFLLLLLIPISLTGETKLPWFSSCALNLESTPQPPPLRSPEMLEPPQNPSTSQYGRRTQIQHLPTKLKLGFHVVGLANFGPIKCSKPNFISCDPSLFQQISRSVINSSLPNFSQSLCCFVKPIEQGHQLGHNAPSLLVGYKNFMRTLPLVTTRDMIHETKSLKEFGIMIPSLRSGDYRSFINSLYLLPLNSKLKQMISINTCEWWIFRAYAFLKVSISLRCFGKFMDNLQTLKSLKKNGILTPSQMRGGYRSFYNLLYPITSSVEPFLKSSYALSARAVCDHSLVEDFAKPVFMVESAMASTDFSNIANFLLVSIFLENSWSLYLYSLCFIVS